ncbi:MAG: hypothetical protein RDU01_08095 [Thermodesulfovibrionales bacterium]|nr:hypothetical protein [Thermodesulfovibrionales bacterium]
MRIFRIGSCRVYSIPNDFNGNFIFLNEPVGYTHTIKEHIQLIKHLRGEKQIPSEFLQYIYTFYGGNQKRQDIDSLFLHNKLMIDKADLYLVEISSLKVIEYNGYYFQQNRFLKYSNHNIPPPSEELLVNYKIYTQNDIDFHRDYVALIDELRDKPIIFTGHINLKKENNEYIENRQTINTLLEKFSKMHGKFYYDLSTKISNSPAEFVSHDLLHLKTKGLILARDCIREIVGNN